MTNYYLHITANTGGTTKVKIEGIVMARKKFAELLAECTCTKTSKYSHLTLWRYYTRIDHGCKVKRQKTILAFTNQLSNI